MTRQNPAHIEPSKHSTDEVDEFLRHVEDKVDDAVRRALVARGVNPSSRDSFFGC